jgi:DNA-binding MarR family transcriptional regulator
MELIVSMNCQHADRDALSFSHEKDAQSSMETWLMRFDLHALPGHLLRRCHQRSQEIFARHVGDDLTRQQAALLIVLAQNAGASQRDLVAATGIDKSTLQEMLGRLIARGWAMRERDPGDRRAWTIRITDGGTALLSRHREAFDRTQREILAPLPADDHAPFLRSLRILAGFEQPCGN